MSEPSGRRPRRLLVRPRRGSRIAGAAALITVTVLSASAVPPASASAAVPVVVIVMENQPYAHVIGNVNAPFINNTLIPGGVLDTNYIAGPGSLPDYLVMVSGQSAPPAPAPNLFAALGTAASWREYMESMPSACYPGATYGTVNGTSWGLYTRYHNPAVQFSAVTGTGLCAADVVPLDATFNPAALPAFSYVVPNECNDMHTLPANDQCPMWNGATNTAANVMKMGDNWLAAFVPAIAKAATVIITWDEANRSNEQVVTIAYGAGVTPGRDGTAYGHASLEAGLYRYFGLGTAPGAGATATPLPIPGLPAPTVPSAPQGLVASGGNGSVLLSWTTPTSAGSSPITGYDIYRGTSPGGESAMPLVSNVTGTSFADTGLTNGTTYYYTVAAVNAVGTSPPSGEASATPQATVPTAPLALAATAGNASVSLSWTAPASNGGSAITSYNVYRGTTSGGESGTPIASNVTGTTFTDSGLTNGTTYYYTVAAVNAVGVSPPSAEVSATPQATAPAAYVRRVGTATASTANTTITVPVGAPGVTAGHTLVVSMLLSSTNITGAITATDTAGNSYVLARDTNDGSAGDRSVILVATAVKALAVGGSITLTYPSAAETHVSVDEFSGVTGIDTSAGATGTTAAFSSGSTRATSQASEILIGALGTESGNAPTWATGWTALPALDVSGDYLDTAYKIVTTTGSYAATGTTTGQWMASILTLKA